MILRSDESEGIQGERNALAILDAATDYIGVDGALTKDAIDVELALKDFNGKTITIVHLYHDS